MSITDDVKARLLGGMTMTEQAIVDSKGKVIEEALFFNDTLYISFTDGMKLSLTHDDPDCCAIKYLICDDDLGFMKGATFQTVVTRDAPDIDAGDGAHEVQFGEVYTNKGSISLAAHNEHNGYYGGIRFVAELSRIS